MEGRKVYCKEGDMVIRFAADDKISAAKFIRRSDTFTTLNGTFFRASLKEALKIVEEAETIVCPVFGQAIELPCKWEWID